MHCGLTTVKSPDIKNRSVVIARSLELMPPHGQKSGVREAGVMGLYVLDTWEK